MAVTPLTTEHYTIVCIAGALCAAYFVFSLIAFKLDLNECKKCKVEFLQKSVGPTDVVYSVSLIVKEKLCKIGTSDLIFRFRGSQRDGPLVLYRDLNRNKIKAGSTLNIGVAMPFSVGEMIEIDISCDNDESEENEPIFSISDVYVRQLPGWNSPVNSLEVKNPNASWKRRATTAAFTSFNSDVLGWVCMDTLTNNAGSGVVGLKNVKKGRNIVLRARDVAVCLPLSKEDTYMKKRAKVGYLALHYMISLHPKWHDMWSDFSHLDNVFVMFLDHITAIVSVSACFAYALERHLGVEDLQLAVQKSVPAVPFTKITNFDLYKLFGNLTTEWILINSLCLVHIGWIALFSCLITIPMSLIWCRLFRFIGGKEFENMYRHSSPTNPSGEKRNRNPNPPDNAEPVTAYGDSDSYGSTVHMSATSLMLRTLECRSVHTGCSISSSRRLRMEPMICNCLPDHVTARSVAYVRTKMARIRDEDNANVLSELKSPTIFHESHTQSTDAPLMPPPNAAPDGSGDVVGVARYCERLVQQVTQHVRDKSVIAECFEIAPRNKRGKMIDTPKSKKICCPRRCCEQNLKCCEEAVSNPTFFTDEEAASLKEMISNFSLQEMPEAEDQEVDYMQEIHTQEFPSEQDVQHLPENDIKIDKEEAIKELAEEIENIDEAPAPSGGLKSKDHSKRRKVHNLTRGEIKEEGKRKSSSLEINENSNTDGSVQIGRRHHGSTASLQTENEKASRSLHRKSKKDRHVSKHKKTKVPFPSAFLENPSDRETERYGKIPLDNKESKSNATTALKRKKIPFKGIKVKVIAFLVIALAQLLEVYFVTAFKNETNNMFFIPANVASEQRPGIGLMHAACLSCLVSIFLSTFVTIHIVALLSWIIEVAVFYCYNNREKPTKEIVYNDESINLAD